MSGPFYFWGRTFFFCQRKSADPWPIPMPDMADRPEHTQKVLCPSEEGMADADGGWLTLFFLTSFHCSAAVLLTALHVLTLLWTSVRHFSLSCAVGFRVAWLILKTFHAVFNVSFKHFFGPPCERLPCCNLQYNSFLGCLFYSWWCGLQTSPTQQSCDSITMEMLRYSCPSDDLSVSLSLSLSLSLTHSHTHTHTHTHTLSLS